MLLLHVLLTANLLKMLSCKSLKEPVLCYEIVVTFSVCIFILASVCIYVCVVPLLKVGTGDTY